MTAPSRMTTLAGFQQAFAQALWSPDQAAPAVARLAGQPGFAVYRNTVMNGCIDALQANFPAVARLVGDEWFRAAAAVFVRREPPDEPMLALYGRGFADFLADVLVHFDPAGDVPYLPDVARVDRLWSEAHAAADAAPLEASTLHALTAADLAQCSLRLHPATRWAWCDAFPVYTLWSRNRAACAVDATPFAWQSEGVLLARPHGAVLQQPLALPGAALLAACAARASIEQAVATALAADPGADAGALIGQCVAAGAFCAVDPLPLHGSHL